MTSPQTPLPRTHLLLLIGHTYLTVLNHDLSLALDRQYAGTLHQHTHLKGNLWVSAMDGWDKNAELNAGLMSKTSPHLDSTQCLDQALSYDAELCGLTDGAGAIISIMKVTAVLVATTEGQCCFALQDTETELWDRLSNTNLTDLLAWDPNYNPETVSTPSTPYHQLIKPTFTAHNSTEVGRYEWFADRVFPDVLVQFPIQPFGNYPNPTRPFVPTVSDAEIRHQPPAFYLGGLVSAVGYSFGLSSAINLLSHPLLSDLLLSASGQTAASDPDRYNWGTLGRTTIDQTKGADLTLGQVLRIGYAVASSTTIPSTVGYLVQVDGDHLVNYVATITNNVGAASLSGIMTARAQDPNSGALLWESQSTFGLIAGASVTATITETWDLVSGVTIMIEVDLSHTDNTWSVSGEIKPLTSATELNLRAFLPTLRAGQLLQSLAHLTFGRLTLSDHTLRVLPEDDYWKQGRTIQIPEERILGYQHLFDPRLCPQSKIRYRSDAQSTTVEGIQLLETSVPIGLTEPVAVIIEDTLLSPSTVATRVTAAGLDTKSAWSVPSTPRLIKWEGLVPNTILGTPANILSKFGAGPIGIGSPTKSTHQWSTLADVFGPKTNAPPCHQTKVDLLVPLDQVSHLLTARTIVWDQDEYRIERLETNFLDINDKGMLSLSLWLRKR